MAVWALLLEKLEWSFNFPTFLLFNFERKKKYAFFPFFRSDLKKLRHFFQLKKTKSPVKKLEQMKLGLNVQAKNNLTQKV